MGTDRDWEIWGATDPYYGVYSSDKFREKNLSEQTRNEFFQSGESHIKGVFDTINRVFVKDFSPRRSLDFGCGVGRLVLPLGSRSGEVVGLDISRSMLAEARKNCSKLDNCRFALADDHLSEVIGTFDLIHSFIVFQHIPQEKGLRLIERLLERVDRGGIAVIHFVYRINAPVLTRFLVRLRYTFRPLHYLRNIYKGLPLKDPPMQMHAYDLRLLLHNMNALGYSKIYQDLDCWDNGTFDMTTIYAQRSEVR